MSSTSHQNTIPWLFDHPTYLVVKLDKSVTHSKHLQSLWKKITCFHHLDKLESLSWGAGVTTLLAAIIAFVHFTVENCTPVRCSTVHTCLIDKPIQGTLRMVIRCQPPMSNNWEGRCSFHLSTLEATFIKSIKPSLCK